MEKVYDNNFNKKVIEPQEEFVLVFVSTYCPHCRTVESYLESIEQEKSLIGNTKIFLVDSEKSPKLLERYMVRSFPISFFFGKDMQNKHTIIGATSLNDFAIGFEKINNSKKESKGFFKRFFKK